MAKGFSKGGGKGFAKSGGAARSGGFASRASAWGRNAGGGSRMGSGGVWGGGSGGRSWGILGGGQARAHGAPPFEPARPSAPDDGAAPRAPWSGAGLGGALEDGLDLVDDLARSEASQRLWRTVALGAALALVLLVLALRA